MTHPNRRSFLKQASALGAAGFAAPWTMNLASLGMASAQSSSAGDYKALVCIFLAGGNDAHNTVLATDAGSWFYYTEARDPAVRNGGASSGSGNDVSLALNKDDLLPIDILDAQGLNTGRTFALNPQLKRIQQLYTAGQAAIVANVGPLITPTLKIDIGQPGQALPKNLMSHNDQTSTWQTFSPEGSASGWGGMMMDGLSARNSNGAFSSIAINSAASGAAWLTGNQVARYELSTSGLYRMAGEGSAFGSTAVYDAVRRIAATPTRPDVLAQDYAKTVQRALSVESILLSSLPPANQAPWGSAATPATDPLLKYTNPITHQTALNPLALQLQLAARMIAARNATAIGAKRQVFMITLGGFDTHSNQNNTHPDLMAKLDHAVGYFYDTLAQMPGGQDLRSNVTTFTASEFGRALTNNGDGTDHGWGGHHFVFGGGVKGGDIYGQFPDFKPYDELNGTYFSGDMIGNGALLPSQSVDQLAYTLGRWLGVSESALVGSGSIAGIAPNIGNFDVASRDLGFMA